MCSVVVATPADVGVMDRRRVGQRVSLVEPFLEDRFHRSQVGGADVVTTLGGGLDALRTVAVDESGDTETRAKALPTGIALPRNGNTIGHASLQTVSNSPCPPPKRLLTALSTTYDRRVQL